MATFRTISKVTLNIASGLLHARPEREPALPGSFVNRRDLRLRDLVGVGAADAGPPDVDLHHDAVRLRGGLAENRLENLLDELHRRVVVVVEDDLVELGPLLDDTGLLEDVCLAPRRTHT